MKPEWSRDRASVFSVFLFLNPKSEPRDSYKLDSYKKVFKRENISKYNIWKNTQEHQNRTI